MSYSIVVKKCHFLILAGSFLLQSCISYEPRILTPAITFSAEDVSFNNTSSENKQVDLGLDVTANESDSLFNVEVLPGVRVRQVVANGPADSAGIQVGDVILSINGVQANDPDVIGAIEAIDHEDLNFKIQARRDTTVFETEFLAVRLQDRAEPVELYRIDPIASRAAYDTQIIDIANQNGVAAARVVEVFAQSPLPNSGIEIGDLILAVDGREVNSAQNLINRLNQDYALGDTVTLTVFSNDQLIDRSLSLWNPGRRVSKIDIGPLFNYDAGVNPTSRNITLLNLWLISLYSYSQIEGEKSHSILGLINYGSDLGELSEE